MNTVPRVDTRPSRPPSIPKVNSAFDLIRQEVDRVNKLLDKAAQHELKREYQPAFTIYIDLANHGYVQAQFKCGVMLAKGRGVDKNPTQGLIQLERAASQGFAPAVQYLGDLYRDGNGVQQDCAKAMEYYVKLISMDCTEGWNRVGLMHLYGAGVEQNYPLAYQHFEEASQSHNADGWTHRARMHLKGQGVEQNLQTAHDFYTTAAEMGSSAACKALGKIYQHGTGVDIDLLKASDFFKRAIELDPDSSASYQLAKLYFQDKQYSEAFKYARLAADNGNAKVWKMLAIFYDQGLFVEQSDAKAFACYQVAHVAKSDDSEVLLELGVRYSLGSQVCKIQSP